MSMALAIAWLAGISGAFALLRTLGERLTESAAFLRTYERELGRVRAARREPPTATPADNEHAS